MTTAGTLLSRLRVLRVFVWALAFFVAAETLLEVRAYRRGWETLFFGRQHLIASTNAEKPTDTNYGPTESFPFRSRIIPHTKTEGTTRIWFASGSYALGENLPPDSIFPALVEQKLTNEGLSAESLNAGRAGHTIVQNIAEIRAEAPDWAPDIVVLYQMSLDITDITKIVLAPPPPGGGGGSTGNGGGPPWPTLLMQRTTLYQLLQEHLAARVTRERILSDTLGNEGARIFESRIRDFIQATNDLGAVPILCTFATSHDAANPDPLPNHVFRFNIRLSRKGWHESIDAYNQIIRRVATEEKVAVADLAPLLLGSTKDFVDFVHFNATGHEKVATGIVAVVRDLDVESRRLSR